ncbi:MAG: 30S ribosomal protein S13 [Candidatus Thermoplasmatota archaeon]
MADKSDSEKNKKTKETTPEEKDKETKEEKKPDNMDSKKEKQGKKKSKDKKQKKKKKSKKESKEEKKEDEDFKYIIRIANTDVDGHKEVVHGLTAIKGLGAHMASLVADEAGIDRRKKIGNLSDKEVEKIREILNNLDEKAPGWMVNHRKDMETGKDIHLVGPDIDMRLRDEINMMKKIRCYRGIRHERGLRVRGQRTRGNNRSGLTVGVSKKEQMEKKKK